MRVKSTEIADGFERQDVTKTVNVPLLDTRRVAFGEWRSHVWKRAYIGEPEVLE